MCLPTVILGLLVFLGICFGVVFALLVMECEENERKGSYY